MTDNIDLASKSAVNSLAYSCKDIILTEVDIYWTNNTGGTRTPPDIIGNSLCPNECSGNGKCLNATCECEEGFLSSDCSIVKGNLLLTYLPLSNVK